MEKTILEVLQTYQPKDQQEEKDLAVMIDALYTQNPSFFMRENPFHFTASAIVVNQDKSKVLFAFHRIYQSWAWLGGHADGNQNLLEVAKKEVKEESGVQHLSLYINEPSSIEILDVPEHVKHGKKVASHKHMNVTYLFIASEEESLRVNEEENRAVAWLPIESLEQFVSEKEMLPIYQKSLRLLK